MGDIQRKKGAGEGTVGMALDPGPGHGPLKTGNRSVTGCAAMV